MNRNYLIIGIVAILGVAAYFIFGRPTNPTTTTPPNGGTTPPNNGGNNNGGGTGANPNTTDPPTGNTASKCGTLRYKRELTDPPFVMLTEAELVNNEDSFVKKMQRGGHNNDFISNAAAFLKGMDLALDLALVRKYRVEITDFKAKAKIKRDPIFFEEVQQQTYDVGSLICNPPNALMRMVGLFY